MTAIFMLILIFSVLFAFITWHKFDFGLFLLFFLLPSYLIRFEIYQIPTTLLEIMILITTLIWLIKKTFTKYPVSYSSLFIAIGIFLLGATISIFTSLNLKSALGEWKAFYFEPILLFFILITSLKTEKQKNNLIFALVLSGFVTALLAIYQKFTGWYVPWEFWENRNTYRVTGWYGFPNAVGLFIAPIAPMALYLLKQKISQLQYILSFLSIPLSIAAIIFAKSTGSLIGLLAGMIILLFIWQKTRKITLILCVAGFLTIFLMPNNSFKQELLLQDRSGQLRLNMWAETIEFLSDHPINGAGLASYQTLIYPYRIDKWIEVFHHPHNIFLTMWVNLGLLGLFGFTWILVWFYRVGLMTTIKNKNLELGTFLISAMTVFVIAGIVDSPYIKNDMAILFWLLPALLFLETKKTTCT